VRTPQILVVEDSDLDFSLIETILRECLDPPDLQRAVDGEQAMTLLRDVGEAVRDRRPDLVILDVNLPRVNGLDVLQFIKSQEFVRDIPVVMFTSSRNEREKKVALNMGAEEFLTKPMNLDLMTTLLNEVCLKYLKRGRSAKA
jgi:chemotaxis family two-component system response regulator Rcp1